VFSLNVFTDAKNFVIPAKAEIQKRTVPTRRVAISTFFLFLSAFLPVNFQAPALSNSKPKRGIACLKARSRVTYPPHESD
jgi:hypothetical protein